MLCRTDSAMFRAGDAPKTIRPPGRARLHAEALDQNLSCSCVYRKVFYGANDFLQFLEHVSSSKRLRLKCARVCADAHKRMESCLATAQLPAPFGIPPMLGTAQAVTDINFRLADPLNGRWPNEHDTQSCADCCAYRRNIDPGRSAPAKLHRGALSHRHGIDRAVWQREFPRSLNQRGSGAGSGLT